MPRGFRRSSPIASVANRLVSILVTGLIGLALLAGAGILAPHDARAGVPQTIVVDGINDFLPANQLENDGGDTQTQNWCVGDPQPESPFDIGPVFVTNDANYLYVGFAYDPDCFRAMAPEIQVGMALDRDPGTGGVNDPIGRKLQWPNPNARPEFVMYDTYSPTNLEQLHQWNTGTMTWNTVASGPNAMQNAESTTFFEARLPLAPLGLAPGQPIGIEFWITRNAATSGPLDAVCNDPVQLSTPGGTTFSVPVPVSMSCLLPYTVQNPAGFISRTQAAQLVINNVILPGPNPSEVVGFLYRNTGPDSFLTAGTIVAPFDSTFVEALPRPTYLFWIDDEPDAFFYHDTRIVFCDAETGQLDVRSARTWPVVDGEEVVSFLEQGNASPDRIHGNYLEGGVLYNVEAVAQDPNDQWGLVIGGMNLKGVEDARAITGDGNRAKEILNKVDKGPRVPAGKITCVGTGDGMTTGATLDEICMAIDAIPEECGKLWVYIVSHGEGGSIIIRGPDGKRQKLPYATLAMKLLGAKAKQVCIVVMACYSGNATSAFDKAANGKGKDAEMLKGKVVTSSSGGQPTDRDPDGSPYMKQLLACWKDCNADFDGDGAISLCEAHAWAALQDPKVAGRGPTAKDLDDGCSIVHYTQSLANDTSSHGATASLKYELVGMYYGRLKSGKVVKPVCRPVLYVANDTGSPVNMKTPVEIECYDEKGRSLGRRTLPRMGFKAKERKCLWDTDRRCRSFRIVEDNAPGRLGPLAAGGVGPLLEVDSRSSAYAPGGYIFHVIPVTGTPGDWMTATVTAVPAGWSVMAMPPAFIFPAAIDTQSVMITGDVPDTATAGGRIVTDIVNTITGDTLRVLIHAMVHDSLGTALTAGPPRRDQYLELWDDLAVSGGTLDLGGSIVDFAAPGSALVGAAGRLDCAFTTFMSDSLRPWSAEIRGRVESTYCEWADATGGLVLDGAKGSLFETSLFRGTGAGLTIKGNMDSLEVSFVLIDSTDGHGLVLDGVTNGYLDNVRIETSGAMDVRMINGGDVELHDCGYDRLKEVVMMGGQLTRSFDTGLSVRTTGNVAIPGAAVTITDALGSVVASDFTDADGFSDTWSLIQYIRVGGVITDHTPHAVRVRLTDALDTTIVVNADIEQTIDLVLPNNWMSSVPPGTPPPFHLGAAAPNPFRTSTDVHFALPAEARVRLAAYDVGGRLVDVLVDEVRGAGDYHVRWRPTGLAAGNYFLRMEAGGKSSLRKVVRLP